MNPLYPGKRNFYSEWKVERNDDLKLCKTEG